MTNPDQKICYENTDLVDYLNEQLEEQQESGIQAHLDSCSNCQKKLEELAADPTVWRNIRSNVLEGETTAQESDKRFERVLEILGPTDNPEMLGRLGNYEICGVIGQGSTGVVLKAFEPRLHRFVAIKVLSPAFSSKGAARKRFEREARAVAAVSHENIVPIFAVDDHRGWPYIVMQFIPGLSLLQRMEKNGPLDTCEVVRIGVQIAKGLSAAHQQGVIHRDVKPANVMLENTIDRALVTDFGLARVADDVSMTQSGVIAGTPQYMSPEQAKGEMVDERSDLFSLGSLLYAACTARPPFRAETIFGVINRVCNNEPRDIREINPRIESWLCDFICRLMSKDIDERFQTADEVVKLLSQELAYLQSPATTKKPTRQWQPKPTAKTQKNSSNTPWPMIAAIVAVFAIISAALWATPIGKDLRTSLGWFGDANHGNSGGAKVSPSSTASPNSFGSAEFFVQEQDFEVTVEPKVAWKPMEDDWSSGTLATFDQKWEQAFDVKQDGRLTINANLGDVVIRPNETKDRVVVTMMRRVEASSQGEAQKTLDQHSLKISNKKREFVFNANFDEEFLGSDRGDRVQQILYRISVPRNFDANVELAKGNITIGELGGDVGAETDMGRIMMDRIGGDIDVEGRGGCIDLRAGCGGKATVLCKNADVYVANVDKGKSTIKMSGGNAWLGECAGEVYCQTSGGDIKVVNAGGKLNAYALDGNVDVYFDKSPQANCGFGSTLGTLNIRIHEDVAAKVQLPDSFEFADMGEVLTSADVDEGWGIRDFNDGEFTIRGKCDSGELNFEVVNESDSSKFKSLGGSGLGGSGLGGSGNGLSQSTARNLQSAMNKVSNEPKAGHFTTYEVDGGQMDGYTLYLPVSFDQNSNDYPVLVSLGGAWTVGGDIESVNLWGLNRMIRDEEDLSNERNKLVLDSFIVIAPHIQEGSYGKHAETVESMIETVAKKFRGDLDRVYLTGLSRGGHGTWGLASRLPEMFAAIVPIAGTTGEIQDDDFSTLTNPAIWIAHNTGDGSFEDSAHAVKTLQQLTGEKFLRVKDSDVSNSQFLDNRLVFVTPERNHHDAWTETYCRPELYEWLLKQSKSNEE